MNGTLMGLRNIHCNTLAYALIILSLFALHCIGNILRAQEENVLKTKRDFKMLS